jgi:hypothetical protein
MNNVAAGSRKQSTSSGIFDNNDGQYQADTSSHRRPPATSQSGGTDVFGNRQNEYVAPTDYQTSSYQQTPQATSSYVSQQQLGAGSGGRGGDTTQSLASVLNGGGGNSQSNGQQGNGQGNGQYQYQNQSQSRPNTGNSSQMGMLMGDQGRSSGQTTGRKSSNAGQSSLVLN